MRIRDAAGSADERIVRAAAHAGCEESRLALSRRTMLGVSAGLFSWAYAPGWASAEEEKSTDPRLLIVVLRGGMDGLSAVVPHGDSKYNALRGDIALRRRDTIKLNSFFGLHPSMKKFGKMYRQGDAAVVHATCVPLRNRSHFDAQDNLENGYPGVIPSTSTGWLNRLLQALPKGSKLVKRGALQVGEAPLILRGSAPVLGWSPETYDHVEDPLLHMIQTLYQDNDRQMYKYLKAGLKADKLASGNGDDDVSNLRKAFRGAARLLRSTKGPRIAVLSVDDWDTHADQGGATGFFANRLEDLDEGIGDFKRLSGSTWKKTVVVMATEFGRTARVNGDDGTDHGVGTVAFLAGGAVKGKKVFGDWPGLSNLYEGSDLKATTDLRAVFKGVLSDHLGVPNSILNNQVFPESKNIKPMDGLIEGSKGDATEMDAADLAAADDASISLRLEAPIARYRKGLPTAGESAPIL